MTRDALGVAPWPVPAVWWLLASALLHAGMAPSAAAQGTVRVVIESRGPAADSGATEYAVRVIPAGVALASYQGRMRFETGALEVLRPTTPPGRGGEARILNLDSLAAGMVRFAAYAPDGFAADEAFRFAARRRGGATAVRIRVALEVAGDPNGDAIPSSRLVAAEGLDGAPSPKAPRDD